MKKRIIISLMFLAIICCTSIYTFATTGIVKTDNLRLRKEDSTSSEILTLLSLGDKIEVINKTENGWYKVKYNGHEGYVSGQFIEVNDNQIEQTKKEEEKKETIQEENKEEIINEKADNENSKVIAKDEKLYGTPLINANTIINIENDTEVKELAQINGWTYICSNDLLGWVRTNKLKNKNESNTETPANNNEPNPTITPTPTPASTQILKEEKGYISGTEVNFRKAPSTNSEVISVLTINKEVTIIETTNGWSKVKIGNDIGYVSATYISKTKVQTTSRSAGYRKVNEEKSENKEAEADKSIKSNDKGEDIVNYAKQYLGYKYVYGGTTPSGFDCSGFTQYVYKHFGYSLNRVSSSQASNGVSISKQNMQPGDLICFSNSKGSNNIGHVGIYIGNGEFIHAANSRKGVIISNVDGEGFYYVCSRRII